MKLSDNAESIELMHISCISQEFVSLSDLGSIYKMLNKGYMYDTRHELL